MGQGRSCPFSPRENVLVLEPSATSVAVASLFDVENLWIVDTGCGNDLISVAKAMFLEHMFQFAPKINFSTANGVHSTSKCLPLFFSVNDEEYVARPYIMSATPPVLSVGLRTMNQGFAFIWLPGLLPCFITPCRTLIPLTVKNGIPYLKGGNIGCPYNSAQHEHDQIRKDCGLYWEDEILKNIL